METQYLTGSRMENHWSRTLLAVCGGFVGAVLVSLISNTSTNSRLFVPTALTRVSNLPFAAVPQNSVQASTPRTPMNLMASQEESEFIHGGNNSVNPAVLGLVAAASSVVGAFAVKFWSHRGPSSADHFDVEAQAAGAAPMTFRTAAPWSSSSIGSGSALPAHGRGDRLILQAAAKGKGKGGGAKGKIAGIIKLALPAGKATPAPPVGPALGQYGLNIVAFCKEYNAATEKEAADGMIIPVEITAFEDRSYTFVLKTPPASVLLRKAAGVPAGSANPKKDIVGSITRAQLEEIAKIKLPDLNTADVSQAMKIVEGTARNMGITIAV